MFSGQEEEGPTTLWLAAQSQDLAVPSEWAGTVFRALFCIRYYVGVAIVFEKHVNICSLWVAMGRPRYNICEHSDTYILSSCYTGAFITSFLAPCNSRVYHYHFNSVPLYLGWRKRIFWRDPGTFPCFIVIGDTTIFSTLNSVADPE